MTMGKLASTIAILKHYLIVGRLGDKGRSIKYVYVLVCRASILEMAEVVCAYKFLGEIGKRFCK